MHLIAKPHRQSRTPGIIKIDVRKTSQQVVLPKAARKVVLRPQGQKSQQPKIIVKNRILPKAISVVKSRPQQGKPRVIYQTKEISEASKNRLNALRNTGKGRFLAILANGPSLLEADTTKLLGQPTIDIMCINKPDKRVWPTKYWLFCDGTQYTRNREYWDDYHGCVINTSSIKTVKPDGVQIKNLGGDGFSTDLIKGFHIGRSSVYAAMQVALWLNYDKIFIFGIDMCGVYVNGKKMLHFFGVNPDVNPENREKRFDAEAKYYDKAGDSLPEEIRKRFYFCSSYLSYGFVNKFSKLDHRTAVDKILELAHGMLPSSAG